MLSRVLTPACSATQSIAARTGLEQQASVLLQERNFGELRGRPYDTLGFDPLVMDAAPPGGESAADFALRLQAALDEMLQHHAGLHGDLVVVTHGLVIRMLLGGPLRLDAERLRQLHLANTSLSIFDADPPHGLQLLNCTRHLDGVVSDDARSLSGG